MKKLLIMAVSVLSCAYAIPSSAAITPAMREGYVNSVDGASAKVLYEALQLPVTLAPEQDGIGQMEVKTGHGFECHKSGIFTDSYGCLFKGVMQVEEPFGYVRIFAKETGGYERIAKSVFENLPEAGTVVTVRDESTYFDRRVGKFLVTKIRVQGHGDFYKLRLDF